MLGIALLVKAVGSGFGQTTCLTMHSNSALIFSRGGKNENKLFPQQPH